MWSQLEVEITKCQHDVDMDSIPVNKCKQFKDQIAFNLNKILVTLFLISKKKMHIL